jgi:hypothetical protein
MLILMVIFRDPGQGAHCGAAATDLEHLSYPPRYSIPRRHLATRLTEIKHNQATSQAVAAIPVF